MVASGLSPVQVRQSQTLGMLSPSTTSVTGYKKSEACTSVELESDADFDFPRLEDITGFNSDIYQAEKATSRSLDCSQKPSIVVKDNTADISGTKYAPIDISPSSKSIANPFPMTSQAARFPTRETSSDSDYVGDNDTQGGIASHLLESAVPPMDFRYLLKHNKRTYSSTSKEYKECVRLAFEDNIFEKAVQALAHQDCLDESSNLFAIPHLMPFLEKAWKDRIGSKALKRFCMLHYSREHVVHNYEYFDSIYNNLPQKLPISSQHGCFLDLTIKDAEPHHQLPQSEPQETINSMLQEPANYSAEDLNATDGESLTEISHSTDSSYIISKDIFTDASNLESVILSDSPLGEIIAKSSCTLERSLENKQYDENRLEQQGSHSGVARSGSLPSLTLPGIQKFLENLEGSATFIEFPHLLAELRGNLVNRYNQQQRSPIHSLPVLLEKTIEEAQSEGQQHQQPLTLDALVEPASHESQQKSFGGKRSYSKMTDEGANITYLNAYEYVTINDEHTDLPSRKHWKQTSSTIMCSNESNPHWIGWLRGKNEHGLRSGTCKLLA